MNTAARQSATPPMIPTASPAAMDAVHDLRMAHHAYRAARGKAWASAQMGDYGRDAAWDDAHDAYAEMMDAAAECAIIGESAAAYCDAMSAYAAGESRGGRDAIYAAAAESYADFAAIIRDDATREWAIGLIDGAIGLIDGAMMADTYPLRYRDAYAALLAGGLPD